MDPYQGSDFQRAPVLPEESIERIILEEYRAVSFPEWLPAAREPGTIYYIPNARFQFEGTRTA